MCTEELNDVIKRIDGYEENIISSKYDEYEKSIYYENDIKERIKR